MGVCSLELSTHCKLRNEELREYGKTSCPGIFVSDSGLQDMPSQRLRSVHSKDAGSKSFPASVDAEKGQGRNTDVGLGPTTIQNGSGLA